MLQRHVKGLQKVTLIDYPKKIACTIFLFGCNFKCGFCHNPELVIGNPKDNYSEEEILEFLENRKNSLDGVCITGGEPLINIEKDFLKKIKKMGFFIKIDTNGSFPEKLYELIDEKLIDFVAMDIKSSPENYEKITNSYVNLKNLEKSIKLISSLPAYEFRTTILPNIHDEDELEKIVEWLENTIEKQPKRFVLQGFKNQGKFIDQSYAKEKDVTQKYLEKLKSKIENCFEEVEIRV
ncbi:anaerobic ribonucleoside-triphosphate reductase activating protein [Candidatus Pacearchaeota archaeon]|nr:anaerobic ribonucleoside-triphosphate reductase activating protein [Candidatus Pacearchaeota archaeon]